MVPVTTSPDSSLPQLVSRLVLAAKNSRRDVGDSSAVDLVGALQSLARLALWIVPSHGVFVPNHEEVVASVSQIATDHLGFRDAQRELYEALERIQADERRESLESAVGRLREVSDAAYFYAGLVFGLTMADTSAPFDAGSSRTEAAPHTT